MDASDFVGEFMSQRELFSDSDLQRHYVAFDFAAHWTRSGFVGTPAFEAVVKAITREDQSLTAEILRRWRVR